MNLQPLGDRLIVEALEEEETTASGIVLPDTAKEKPQRGRVLAVGPGPRDEDGEYVKMDLEPGDEIIFSKYGGTDIKLGRRRLPDPAGVGRARQGARRDEVQEQEEGAGRRSRLGAPRRQPTETGGVIWLTRSFSSTRMHGARSSAA